MPVSASLRAGRLRKQPNVLPWGTLRLIPPHPIACFHTPVLPCRCQVDGTYFLPKHWRDAPDIRFGDPESPGQTPPVVAASLFMLIERITYDIHPDMRLLSAVLLLHKEFATSLEFFEKLTSRFVIEDDAVDEHRQVRVSCFAV